MLIYEMVHLKWRYILSGRQELGEGMAGSSAVASVMQKARGGDHSDPSCP